VSAWVTVAFCVLRGLPVIMHAARQYWKTTEADGSNPPAYGATS